MGTLKKTVTDGTADVTATFAGVPVAHETYDLCKVPHV